MPRANLPAILREPLEEVCLQIKLMPPILPNTSTNRCAAVLATAIAPPRGAAVSEALDMLVEIGAIDNLRSEQLTPLGLLIAKLPVSPRVGKLLVLGTLLGCASSVLTIAATLHSDGDPWLVQSSAEERDAQGLSRAAMSGGWRSDNLIQTLRPWP